MSAPPTHLTTTVTRDGKNAFIEIDPSLLQVLKIQDNTLLNIFTDGKRIIVEPVEDEERARRFKDAVAEADREYPNMFKRLAQ